MDDTVVLALCRHGLTEANKNKAYLGWTDSPLLHPPTPLTVGFEGYFTSDLERCITTIKGFFPHIEPKKLSDLREMNFGDFEGCNFEKLKENVHYNKWIHNYETLAPPNGETFQQFTDRISNGWNEIVAEVFKQKWKHSIIVAHAGVIRYYLHLYAPEEKGYWDWEVPHEEYYEFTFTNKALLTGQRAFSLKKIPINKGDHT
jgi:alpha-ribazole phosphatase